MNSQSAWILVLMDLAEKKIPCVLVTVIEAKGSTPRERGTKMVVIEMEQFGTIGGGNLEFQILNEARKLLLDSSNAAIVKTYLLGPTLGQCCGGAVTVLLEPFFPIEKELLLFGAGHVGREVVKVLEHLPVVIKWIDERETEFPLSVPVGCQKIMTSAPIVELRNISEKSFIVIMTHSHELDYELVKTSLLNGKFAYLGLIGSDTKRAKFEKRLLLDDVEPAELPRLISPIGLKGIVGKHPREIAISIAAQLLEFGLTRTCSKTSPLSRFWRGI